MIHTWKVLILSVLINTFAANAWADFVGLKIGAAGWAPEISGSINSGTDPSIDLANDLGLDDPSETSVQLILEHPIPILPNIKYQRSLHKYPQERPSFLPESLRVSYRLCG